MVKVSPNKPTKMERYMGFLVQEWSKMASTPLVSPVIDPVKGSSVLDVTISALSDTPGLRLELGVWHGSSINRCASQFPNQHWYGFDSFEGFPDDGRIDWQKPFKVDTIPDTPENVTLIDGYFSDTLHPFLQKSTDEVAFLNIDCSIYSSTAETFRALEKNDRLQPGLVMYFGELINYVDYMWNESLALFEMLERTGFGVTWLCHDQNLRSPEQSAQHFHDGDHPTWMEDVRAGYWMQATCVLVDEGIDCGPMDDPVYREKLRWILDGFHKQEARRVEALKLRNARLEAQEVERQERFVARKKREKERQLEIREQRRLEREQA